jgi:hypothetical protein
LAYPIRRSSSTILAKSQAAIDGHVNGGNVGGGAVANGPYVAVNAQKTDARARYGHALLQPPIARQPSHTAREHIWRHKERQMVDDMPCHHMAAWPSKRLVILRLCRIQKISRRLNRNDKNIPSKDIILRWKMPPLEAADAQNQR